ncbi:UNVERIFIED_CONTAM: hypothetical protein FKN15_007186 [Acipenser sinensis]
MLCLCSSYWNSGVRNRLSCDAVPVLTLQELGVLGTGCRVMLCLCSPYWNSGVRNRLSCDAVPVLTLLELGALFTYDGTSNKLKLSDSGAGGAAELAGKLHSSRPLYGFCRVEAPGSGQPRLVMIIWEAHVFINAHSPAEVTVENINNIVSKIAPPADRLRRQARVADTKETVREEEERKEEERRRVLEERRQWERERVLQERKEAEERERKLSEKESLQEEQR